MMTTLPRLAHTRCFLLDMDGTIYLGDRLIDGALDFLATLPALGIDFMFLTNNSSKNSAVYVDKLARLGIHVDQRKILTSGAATAEHMQRMMPGARVYVVGTPAMEAEFADCGFTLAAIDEPADAAVLGFDTTLTYAKLWRLCELARAGVPYIATHPDNNCPIEDSIMPDIGAMIAFVHTSAERLPDLIVGKPNRLIAESASQRAGVPVEALCMVGDRLTTDIALGANSGMPTVLVLSGETCREEVPLSPHQPDYIFAHLGELAAALRAASPHA